MSFPSANEPSGDLVKMQVLAHPACGGSWDAAFPKGSQMKPRR